jgi:hypothetical protein
VVFLIVNCNSDVYKLISAAVNLFDWLYVGIFRLSSYARLEALVIQYELNLLLVA